MFVYESQVTGDKVFPHAYGTENETGLMDDFSGEFDEPYGMCNDLEEYVPHNYPKHVGRMSTMFFANGFKLYIGGTTGDNQKTNLERATPECRSIAQLNLAVRAGEQLVLKTVENYISLSSAEQGRTISARYQGRVVDSTGSRKACHDNFGIPENSPLAKQNMSGQLLRFIAASIIVDGAGHVTHSGMRYSQKVHGLRSVSDYGYTGTVYRTSDAEGTPRLEIRCKDNNISDWATRMRLGGTALAIAISQTELRDELPTVEDTDVIALAKLTNTLRLNYDGTIRGGVHQRAAADVLMRTAELTMSKLLLYVDEIPDELMKVASELYRYAEDYRKVIDGDETIALLADRADWAAKGNRIVAGIAKDKDRHIRRTMTDHKSRFIDLYYDYIGMSATDGEIAPRVYGLGYKLRERGFFRAPFVTDKQAEQSLWRAPTGTRAEARGNLIRHYRVDSCDWDTVVLRDEDRLETFHFRDVLETSVSPEDAETLRNIKKVR